MRIESIILSLLLHGGVLALMLFWPGDTPVDLQRQSYQVSLVMGAPGGEELPSPVLGARPEKTPDPQPERGADLPDAQPDAAPELPALPEMPPVPDAQPDLPAPVELPDRTPAAVPIPSEPEEPKPQKKPEPDKKNGETEPKRKPPDPIPRRNRKKRNPKGKHRKRKLPSPPLLPESRKSRAAAPLKTLWPTCAGKLPGGGNRTLLPPPERWRSLPAKPAAEVSAEGEVRVPVPEGAASMTSMLDRSFLPFSRTGACLPIRGKILWPGYASDWLPTEGCLTAASSKVPAVRTLTPRRLMRCCAPRSCLLPLLLPSRICLSTSTHSSWPGADACPHGSSLHISARNMQGRAARGFAAFHPPQAALAASPFLRVYCLHA